ncbi:sorbosone dehydrogenase family protein [Microbacterium sp. 1.5R]|uniref:PQQ-dependent sugar dehydrogenase n=1 Tax=Microbacterium sp. 1.5R TaxID=1916917 RepID=UPI0011A0F465|nr:PQQ-dependent sugar dehydrogenase [Microbacterium sp. 1.5R]
MPSDHDPPLARRALAAAATASVLLLAACAAEPRPASTALSDTVADRLEAPWSVAFHEGVALVSERDSARILELGDDDQREVGTIEGVAHGGEGGLLGIAVHEGELFTYFTAEGENRVERREISGDAGALELGPAVTVIDGIPSARTHNGGRIAFGPDGMLYVTAGDAGDRDSAQDPDALSGKILRLAPDGAVPDDNPFDDSPVWSLGHRNPQGIAWDADGTMYASEFGQDTWDELNVIEPGGNYGWPEVEGIAEDDDFIDPVQQWEPNAASPSGIAVVGADLLIANLRGERLRIVPLDGLSSSTELVRGELGRLRDVVAAPDGVVWVVTNNTDGRGSPQDGDDRIVRIEID